MKKSILAILCLMLTVCGILTFSGCNNSKNDETQATSASADEASHEHSFDKTLSYDEEFHFYACTFDGCTSKSSKNKHVFNSPEVLKEGNKVTRTYKCKSCRYTKTEISAEEYSVMSSNLLGKYPQDASEDKATDSRMKTIAECIKHYAPDSVGFQEYGSQNKLFLTQYLPSEYKFVDFGQDWIPTLYNSNTLVLEDSACTTLTTTSNQQYRFTAAVFSSKTSGDMAYIHCNLHLEYKDAATRLTNAEEINEALHKLFEKSNDYSSLPLVITGDYNAAPETEPKVFETISDGHNIKNSVEVAKSSEKGQATYHKNVGVTAGVGNAIDHVLVQADTTKVYSHNIIKENDYADILSASDHYPVLVEFSKQ